MRPAEIPTILSYSYGMSDLNYYGNFMTVPGLWHGLAALLHGRELSPFRTAAGLSIPAPAICGFRRTRGDGWPYRYGNWAFVPGYGWIWQPGYWNSWYPLPRCRESAGEDGSAMYLRRVVAGRCWWAVV